MKCNSKTAFSPEKPYTTGAEMRRLIPEESFYLICNRTPVKGDAGGCRAIAECRFVRYTNDDLRRRLLRGAFSNIRDGGRAGRPGQKAADGRGTAVPD